MPLTDLGELVTHTEGGAAFFAVDETGARVLITLDRYVLERAADHIMPAWHDEEVVEVAPGPSIFDRPGFRASMVAIASDRYDAGPKDGYVILDMEALDLPA